MVSQNSFSARTSLQSGGKSYSYYSLPKLAATVGANLDKLPFSIRVLLENVLRNEDGKAVKADQIRDLANWDPAVAEAKEIAYMPSRVILQDFTGVPSVVDLAAMRDAVVRLGAGADKINPVIPADLVIDHSVQVDVFARPDAAEENARIEFERNLERYGFLRWGQSAFEQFRVVPPDTGIVHQINLEYLAQVAFLGKEDGDDLLYPDSCVGTDSHTTMINGLSVFGWGVGGIEAEAVMMGQPYFMLVPQVIGFKLEGKLPQGATATDLVLTVTQMLRARGVVGKFVEFYGSGLDQLTLADRATLANMAPEYGATMGFFPVDDVLVEYLHLTGRDEEQIARVTDYYKAQGMYRTPDTPDPAYTDSLFLDMDTVVPSIAGPKRPQDRIELSSAKQQWAEDFPKLNVRGGESIKTDVTYNGETFALTDGDVVIAAITSCTNTSNPSVLIAAGLLAQKAVAKGLARKPWVKTSFGPGSLTVPDYLKKAGLTEPLAALGFDFVGFGCTTCIGNSGPLPDPIAAAIEEKNFVCTSVLSGNRNFEGRISPHVRGNYLASPPLVVAYAIAGTMNLDLDNEPLGQDTQGNDVFLKDIWPGADEIRVAMADALDRKMFSDRYADVFKGDARWQAVKVSGGAQYDWQDDSTYVQNPPFFDNVTAEEPHIQPISGARVLALLGDSVTTDHISPAGSIPKDGPAGRYLQEHGVSPTDFNSFGSRRGNHEVMMRGTFANIRIRNQLIPGTEGGYTRVLPDSDNVVSIFDAAMTYAKTDTPLTILAGKEYGTGSSRDWAAKGTALLGVKVVIAQSFERIHRSNLVGFGVLPLQFKDGQSAASLGLDGTELISVEGISDDIRPHEEISVQAQRADGTVINFTTIARLDTPIDVDYYRSGGILHYVLRQMAL